MSARLASSMWTSAVVSFRPAQALLLGALVLLVAGISAHPVSDANAAFVSSAGGAAVGPFLYLGAKHMVTGVDHVLYLFGVIFLLFRTRDVLLAVSLFTLGHSTTLLAGVLLDWQANVYVVDALIGLSVVYKALENLSAASRLPANGTVTGLGGGRGVAIFAFGLVHGCGLATRLGELDLAPEGLLANLLAFNVGVEAGQFVVLVWLLALMALLRPWTGFQRATVAVNFMLMTAGYVLAGDQFVQLLQQATA